MYEKKFLFVNKLKSFFLLNEKIIIHFLVIIKYFNDWMVCLFCVTSLTVWEFDTVNDSVANSSEYYDNFGWWKKYLNSDKLKYFKS